MRYIIIFLLLTCYELAYSQEKIEIENKARTRSIDLGVDEFYFIHHIFADAFFMTNLSSDVDTSDIEKIVKEVQPKLSESHPVIVKIKRKEKPDAWLEFSVLRKDEGKILMMKTNYLQKSKSFTSDLDNKNLFARMYFIKGEKLVYRKDLYSKEEEETRKKESQHTLAEYYLFNDRVEDDTLVLGLLDPIIASDSSSNLDKLYAMLYYTEYYLSVGNFSEADKKLSELNTFYNDNKDKIPSAYELIVRLAGIEVYLNHKIRSK